MAKKNPIKPLGFRVLLKEYEAEDAQGSILLPDDAKDSGDLLQAEVLALGNAVGSEDEKIQLSVGDKVFIRSFSGDKVKVKGEEYLIAKSMDIVAVIG